MARLVAELERDLFTDFALLSARQDGVNPSGLTVGTFAASEPGILSMVTGTKYSDMRVRLERWDSRPDWVGDDWEDCDELPWAPLPGGGRLSVQGFDPPTGEGLLVEDIGTARVQVFASGRHQYSPGDLEGSAPERWLVRLWPEPGPPDALAGPPRRIAGPLPYSIEPSPWEAAVHGSFPSCDSSTGPHRSTPRCRWHPRVERCIRGLMSSARNWPRPLACQRSRRSRTPSRACCGWGSLPGATRPRVSGWYPTPRQTRSPRCSSSPTPSCACETYASPHIDVSYLEGDLYTLTCWSPSGLVTTPRTIAVRLSVPAKDVVDALRVRALSRPGALDVEPHEIGPDTTVTLRAAPWAT